MHFSQLWQSLSQQHRAVLFSGVGLVLIACGGESGDSQQLLEAVQVGQLGANSLVVRASDQSITTIALAEQLQYQAFAVLESGDEQEVTQEVNWLVDNTAVATIDANGLLTAGTPQGSEATNVYSVVVSASLANLNDSQTLMISDAELSSLVLSPDTPTVDECLTITFSVQGVFTDGSERSNITGISYLSSNTAIADFDPTLTGLLRTFTTTLNDSAIDQPIQITATSQAISATTQVSISDTLTGLSVTGEPVLDLTDTTTGTLQVTGQYLAEAVDITSQSSYSSSDPTIVSVSSTGQMTSEGAGEATMTASCGGQTNTHVVTVVEVDSYTIETDFEGRIPEGETVELIYYQVLSDGTQIDISDSEDTEWSIVEGDAVIESLEEGELVMVDSFSDSGYTEDSIQIRATYEDGNIVEIPLLIDI